MFSFVVNVTLTLDWSTFSCTLEANDYIDGEEREFTIDGLMAGGVYLFSAKAQNQFGASDFSNSSLLIHGRFKYVHGCGCGCGCAQVH